MANVIALHFDEADGVQITDASGNAGDFVVAAGLTEPTSTHAWSGSGRSFTVGDGYISHGDISDGGSICQRDCTVQAILSLAAVPVAPQVIFARGTGVDPGDYVCVGLELLAGGGGLTAIRLFWQDVAGAYHYQTPVAFDAPIDQFMLITATREWQSTTAVRCRYYVADELIGETTSGDGDIGGGTTALCTIGAQRSAGVWAKHFVGVLDDVIVNDHCAPAAEVRHIWLTLTIFLPAGRTAVAALLPPGLDADAPHKATHRWITLGGQTFGLAFAQAEELRSRWFPQSCDEAQMAEWEYHFGVVPAATLAQRSARVLAAMAEPQGHALPALRTVFSAPLALPSPDVDIVEFGNELIEPWLDVIEIWQPRGGTWLAISDELVGSVAANVDHRWASRSLALLRTLIVGQSLRINAATSILTHTLANGSFAGLMIYNAITWEGVAIGVRRDAILGMRIVSLRLRHNGIEVIDRGPAAADTFVCIREHRGASLITPGFAPIDVGWCNTQTDADAGAYFTAEVSCGVAPTFIGMAIMAETIHAAIDTATFGAFKFLDLNSTDPFLWYAYRDPLLPDVADLVGGENVARRITPARSSGHAIDRLVAVADTLGVADRVPCGAYNRR